MATSKGMTRSEQSTNVIYRTPDGLIFSSPDGEGRVYYASTMTARAETGLTKVIQLANDPEDY